MIKKSIILMLMAAFLIIIPLVKADIINNESVISATYPFRESGGVTYLASNFTNASESFTLKNASIYMYKVSNPDNNVWVSIEGCDGSFKPNGTELATSDTRLSSSIASSGTWENFVFSGAEQITLIQNECYNVIIKSDSTLSAANYFRVGAPAQAGIPNHFYVYNGAAWGTDARDYASNQIYGDIAGAPPVTGNLTIRAFELYNGTALNKFTAHLIGYGDFETSTGVIETNVSETNNTAFTILITSNQSGGYFNVTYSGYNISLSGDINTSMFQSEIHLTAYEKVTGNQLFGLFNTSTKTNTSLFYLPAELYNITFSNNSYFNTTQEFNITALLNTTLNISSVYNSIANITVYNAFTGLNISNFNGWVANSTYGFNESFNASNGIAFINLLQNISYLFFVEHFNYSISTANYRNVTINNTLQNVNFSLYSNNSINIRIYDETTSQLITTETITMVLSGALGDTTYNTTNGTLYIDNLQDGNYTLKFSGGNYSLRTYEVTVAEKSTQNLNAYLSPNTVSVTFTFLDFDTSETLEGVSVSMARLINGSWTTIESKTSDITGRSQFTYTPNIKYRFTCTLSGYVNKVFELDPIIFSSYNVRMNKVISYDKEQDYQSIGINYFPTTFYNNKLQNFTFTINSPSGTLQYYGINITYPGGNSFDEGTNSIGETFILTLNISGAGILDNVNITFYYDTTIGDLRTFSYTYGIIGANVSNQTFIMMKNNTFGLGAFERVLITVMVVLIVTGLITLVSANPLIGGGIGLLLMGFLAYIGFMPLWAALISFLAGLFIIFKMAGGS